MDNYEEKYKAALGWMQSLYGGLHGATKEEAEKYFPELKEPNDERIRKELIEQVAYITPNNDELDDELNTLPTYQKRIDKYRAWLEKQDHMLDAAKVIEWLKRCNITDCDMRTSIIPDSSPTSIPHRVRWFSEDFIDKFKKDFGLC